MNNLVASVNKRRGMDDKGRGMDVLDFCKAFDTVPHNLLLSKLERDSFDG